MLQRWGAGGQHAPVDDALVLPVLLALLFHAYLTYILAVESNRIEIAIVG